MLCKYNIFNDSSILNFNWLFLIGTDKMRDLKIKIILPSLGILTLIAFLLLKSPSMPSYTPDRDYLDMEIPILEAFITAQDSSVIELPEGHYLFSQSLILDGKKNITLRGKGIEKTVFSFKGQKQGAEGIRISNCKNLTIETCPSKMLLEII